MAIRKNKGKILSEIIPSLSFKGDKREREIEKRIRRENRFENETKSQFWYYMLKELTLHRTLFQSIEKKQFAEDVRTMYKWYIHPSLNTLSEIRDKFNFRESFLEILKVTKEFDSPTNLPNHSVYLQIKFSLRKPFISKDDDEFYIIDNPIVKDKVFKLPMVRSTTWKGALRFAAVKVFEEEFDKSDWKEKRALLIRLFGNEKEVQEKYLDRFVANKTKNALENVRAEFETYLKGKKYISEDVPSRAGRLFFYPTFFDEISIDVITPLSRETKTPVRGRAPIYFETVREGTEGIFRLLYYPFDLIARGEFDKIEDEMKEDLDFLSKALQKMFYEIGFSAKKSSGFGVISEFDGEITIPFKNIKNLKFNSFNELNFSKLYTKVNKGINSGASE